MRIVPSLGQGLPLIVAAFTGAALFFAPMARAADYFVAKTGSDQADGRSEATAFATIQKGVNVLAAGDTLTIGPGEYAESVRRVDLGEAGKTTRIRARIPGTVVLRGDKPVGPFKKTPGYKLVYETPEAQEILCVSEADTLTPLYMRPNLGELDLAPGGWFYDKEQKKLYISGTDSGEFVKHVYRGTVVAGDGFCLEKGNSVVIEGLAATGFNDFRTAPAYRTDGAGHLTIWGFYIYNSRNCEIVDCVAYLNGGGIGINNTQSLTARGGDNRAVRCTVYGNGSQLAGYQSSGIGIYNSNGDEIRDCLAFKNHAMGLRTYLQLVRPARIIGSTAWNNRVTNIRSDIHLKDQVGKNGERTTVENSVALSAIKAYAITNSIVPNHIESDPGRELPDVAKMDGSIFLANDFDIRDGDRMGFADAANLDFRLQADSSARGAVAKDSALGVFSYKPDIFYVRGDGNDEADGLSVAAAWKTLGRAVAGLKPGQTLYIEPGVYEEDLKVTLEGSESAPIVVKGRGTGAVVLRGDVQLAGAKHVVLERLNFSQTLDLVKTADLRVAQCQFLGNPIGISAEDAEGLRITNSVFAGFGEAALMVKGEKSSGLFLSGNLYDNRQGVAAWFPSAETLQYADYNGYGKSGLAYQIGERKMSLADMAESTDRNSHEIDPALDVKNGVATSGNPLALATNGPLGRPIGTFREEARQDAAGLTETPSIHSVSTTTANLEWKGTTPLVCRMAWGDTPECAQAVTFESNIVGTYSLQGLKPGKTYYFRIDSVRVPPTFYGGEETDWVDVNTPVISFTTATEDTAPVTYYVAPDGDNANTGLERGLAWKTIGHAASKVNVGDKVLVAGGTYSERVIMRATGRKDAPITFAALPGEKVQMKGADQMLTNAFVAFAKNHLRFDGFYIADYALKPNQGWIPGLAADFCLYLCEDIQITRCFSDGRGGYSARTVNATDVKDLLIKNVVSLNKVSGALYINHCENFRLENSVIARPMIASFLVGNSPSEPAWIKNNIFTDCLEKKAKINAELFDFSPRTLHENNVYFLRDAAKREITRGKKVEELQMVVKEPYVGDPAFAGLVGVPPGKGNFPPDRFIEADRKLDFASFFATNPEVVQRKIGLQPDAFGLPQPLPASTSAPASLP